MEVGEFDFSDSLTMGFLNAGNTENIQFAISFDNLSAMGFDSIEQVSTRLRVFTQADAEAFDQLFKEIVQLIYSQAASLSPDDPDFLDQYSAIGNQINAQLDELNFVFNGEITLLK